MVHKSTPNESLDEAANTGLLGIGISRSPSTFHHCRNHSISAGSNRIDNETKYTPVAIEQYSKKDEVS